jgi:hypothetical protein
VNDPKRSFQQGKDAKLTLKATKKQTTGLRIISKETPLWQERKFKTHRQ